MVARVAWCTFAGLHRCLVGYFAVDLDQQVGLVAQVIGGFHPFAFA